MNVSGQSHLDEQLKYWTKFESLKLTSLTWHWKVGDTIHDRVREIYKRTTKNMKKKFEDGEEKKFS